MQSYFQQLNYTMANEDTSLEYELCRRLGAKHVLSVGGSGARALPFLALPLETLRIVDVSADQILLIRLKLKTIRDLSREEAIDFWTHESRSRRDEVFLKLQDASKFEAFYRFHSEKNPDIPPLYWGKWEKTFRTFSKLTGLFFSKKIRENLFESDRPHAYFKKHIQGVKWNLLLNIVGNRTMFNSLLYKGSFIKKNSPLSYFEYYAQAFERLFHLDVKKSHFLQLCFCGKVLKEEALPIEFSPEIFQKIKDSLLEPEFEQGSIFEREEETRYDLISLSDVPSYLSGELEKKYVQTLEENIAPYGVIVNRFYLRSTENTDIKDFRDITLEHRDIIQRELVQMYQVQLLQKVPHEV